jgi:hypothetical protein
MYVIGIATLSGERAGSSSVLGARRRSFGTVAVIRVAAPGLIAFDVTP